MGSGIELGILERISARSVWKHEAHQFTPWLRQNIHLLGEALGLEIEEDIQQEVAVGLFSADLLGSELGSKAKILIENQLEQTDHSHLGQLLTYAGGLDTDILVWISTDIRDEHRQALTWLNVHTHEGIYFFGVEIELLKIGASSPAPHFKVVVAPNDWQKSGPRILGQGGGQPGAIGERELRYREFWKRVLGEIKQRDPHATSVRAENIMYGNWWSIPLGRSGFFDTCAFGWEGSDRIVRCEIYIDVGEKAQNKAIFDTLHSGRETLEAAVGEPLIWTRRDDIRASRIYLHRPGTIDDTDDILGDISQWAADRLLRLRDAFRPLIKGLLLPIEVAEDEPTPALE